MKERYGFWTRIVVLRALGCFAKRESKELCRVENTSRGKVTVLETESAVNQLLSLSLVLKFHYNLLLSSRLISSF